MPKAGDQIGARHVREATLRQAGSQTKSMTHVVDAAGDPVILERALAASGDAQIVPTAGERKGCLSRMVVSAASRIPVAVVDAFVSSASLSFNIIDSAAQFTTKNIASVAADTSSVSTEMSMRSASVPATTPVNTVATTGVAVDSWIDAKLLGRYRFRPSTASSLALDSRAVMVDVVMPHTAPAETRKAARGFPCAKNAALYGAVISISVYGCMRTMENAIPMYNIEATSKEVTMLLGMSRVGLMASSAALGRLSKPMKEKKTIPAALNTPDIPKGKKPPVPSVRLAMRALPTPEMITSRMHAMFSEHTAILNLADSLIPTQSMRDKNAMRRNATGSSSLLEARFPPSRYPLIPLLTAEELSVISRTVDQPTSHPISSPKTIELYSKAPPDVCTCLPSCAKDRPEERAAMPAIP